MFKYCDSAAVLYQYATYINLGIAFLPSAVRYSPYLNRGLGWVLPSSEETRRLALVIKISAFFYAGHFFHAGAVLVAMQILTALGLLRLIDLVLGEEHTSIEYLKQEMAEGRKQVPSSGILIGLLVADMLAYPKRIVRVYEVQKLAKAWHTDKLLGIDPDLLNDDPAEGKIHSANLSQAWSRPLALGFLSRLTCWQEVPMIVQPCLRH